MGKFRLKQLSKIREKSCRVILLFTAVFLVLFSESVVAQSISPSPVKNVDIIKGRQTTTYTGIYVDIEDETIYGGGFAREWGKTSKTGFGYAGSFASGSGIHAGLGFFNVKRNIDKYLGSLGRSKQFDVVAFGGGGALWLTGDYSDFFPLGTGGVMAEIPVTANKQAKLQPFLYGSLAIGAESSFSVSYGFDFRVAGFSLSATLNSASENADVYRLSYTTTTEDIFGSEKKSVSMQDNRKSGPQEEKIREPKTPDKDKKDGGEEGKTTENIEKKGSKSKLPDLDASEENESADAPPLIKPSVDWKKILARGKKQLKKRKFEKARKSFSKVNELRPGHVNTLIYLGVTESKMGELEKAVGRMEKVLELDPGNQVARRNLEKLKASLENKQKKQEPKADWKKLYKRAKEQYQRQRYEKARKLFLRVKKQNPKHVNNLIWLGITEYKLDHIERAKSLMNRVLKLDPDNQFARKNLERMK